MLLSLSRARRLAILALVFLGWVHLALALTAPSSLTTSNVKATAFTLRWTAATGATGGIAGYDVYRDGVLIGTTTTRAHQVTGLLPTTPYVMTVVAHDRSGSTSVPSTALIVTTAPDTNAPGRPTGLTSSGVTTNSITLSWSAPTDNVGVAGYNLYQSGTLVGTAPTTTAVLNSLSADTVHRLAVRAFDAAGNLSGATALNVRTLALPPSTPTELVVSNLRAASFILKWTASTGGTGGIASYDVYANSSLVGNTTKRSFSFIQLTPLTSYTLVVAARDHEGRVSPQSASVIASTPADTTKPSAPKDLGAAEVTHQSFVLSWTASSDNVSVAGYDVLKNNVLVGSVTTPGMTLSGLAPTTVYQMKVRAKDQAGNISAASAALPVTTAETPNLPPSVTLTAPQADASFTSPGAVALAATAADTDGTLTKVEFFDGSTKLGEAAAPTPPSTSYALTATLTASGRHTLFARATDNRNASVDSAPVQIRVLPGLPLMMDFEESEGFLPGPLHDQAGWQVSGGSAVVTTNDAERGVQAVSLSPGATLTVAALEIGSSTPNPSPVFADVFSRPVADTAPDAGTLLDLDAARIGFIEALDQDGNRIARVQTFAGGGNGSGTWTPTLLTLPIDADRKASAWHRFTARLDYATKTWDLHVDGKLVAVDLPFRTATGSYLANLAFRGHPEQPTGIDDLFAGADNPLFTDADHDGMDDDWETGHGLSAALNDRQADPDGDGVSNIREFLHETDPQNPDTDQDGLPDGQELTLGTDPRAADSDGDGLPDGWEVAHGLDPRAAADALLDGDGDGQNNLDEYQAGTDPIDYYNAGAPIITVLVGADGLPGADGLIQIQVTNASGLPLINAPVRVSVTQGTSLIAESPESGAPTNENRSLRTTADGLVSVFYRPPANGSTAGAVEFRAGLATQTVVIQEQNGGGQTATVQLIAPQEGASIESALGIVLVATASVADSAVEKMEFYADGAKIGETTAAPFRYTWSTPSAGSHVLTAKMSVNGGTVMSAPVTITYTPNTSSGVVYDFEPAEGYAIGPVAGQGPWSGHEEAVRISDERSQSGLQALQVLPPAEGGDPLYVQAELPPPPEGHPVRFVDFWLRPVSGSSVYLSSWFALSNGPMIGFVGNGDTAELQVYENNEGDSKLHRSGRTIPIDAGGSATAWQRLTIRLDFERGRQDIYLNGQPAVGDLRISTGNTYFTLYGHSNQTVWMDQMRLLSHNPLFIDNDLDGLDDAWEAAHGLDPSINDRRSDLDGDSIRNANEYFLGSNPQSLDSDGDGLPDEWEYSVGLNPAVPIATTQDTDQDGLPDKGEFRLGTDINNPDTDGDQLFDGEEDDDGDGLTSAEEYANGTDPQDYFNGLVPVVTSLADYSTKLGLDGMVAVRITNQAGTPLRNAPVQFSTGGSTLLTANPYGMGKSQTLVVRADEQGIARAYLRPAN